jgi:hypothetical protein
LIPAVGVTYSKRKLFKQVQITFNAAGTYNLVIKDGNGCAAVDYIVYRSDLKLHTKNLIVQEILMQELLTTTGGNPLPSPSYTYTVAINGATAVAATSPYTAAVAGEYVFTVTDATQPKNVRPRT